MLNSEFDQACGVTWSLPRAVFYRHRVVCPAVVFVIDSCHRDRLMEAHSELAKLLTEKELRDALLLIFANKQVPWR